MQIYAKNSNWKNTRFPMWIKSDQAAVCIGPPDQLRLKLVRYVLEIC